MGSPHRNHSLASIRHYLPSWLQPMLEANAMAFCVPGSPYLILRRDGVVSETFGSRYPPHEYSFFERLLRHFRRCNEQL